VERGAQEDVAGGQVPSLACGTRDLAGSRQTALFARATRGLGRPSLDARSKGQSAYSLRNIEGRQTIVRLA